MNLFVADAGMQCVDFECTANAYFEIPNRTEIVSSDASLEDCGVVGGECIIYYDFMPVSGALLR